MAKEAVQAGDHGTAAAIYSQVLQREPENPEAIGGLARAMIARGELDQARRNRLIQQLPPTSQQIVTTTSLDWLAELPAGRVCRLEEGLSPTDRLVVDYPAGEGPRGPLNDP